MTLAIPESLANPRAATAERRRAIEGAKATTAAPVASDAGFHTRNHRYLHLAAACRVGGSASVTLWGRHEVSGVWAVMTWIGTSGVVSLTFAGGPLILEPALLAGIDRVYPQVSAYTGPAELDVWLAGSSF